MRRWQYTLNLDTSTHYWLDGLNSVMHPSLDLLKVVHPTWISSQNKTIDLLLKFITVIGVMKALNLFVARFEYIFLIQTL